MGEEPTRIERGDLFEQRSILAADLTHSERTVLTIIEAAAEAGRELDANDDIAEHLGFSGSGTVRGIMLRLERKGYIVTESYQRGRRVFSKRMGKWTQAPLCTVPHWRTVLRKSKSDTPTLPFHKLAEIPTILQEARRMMLEHSMTLADAQLALMSRGVSMLAAERAMAGGE